MEIRCRCHGLSGSCSLKTCWLVLPNFQLIGNYLKKKYEASVHLPSAVNVNKLIPMMDRNEISAILSNSVNTNQQHQVVASTGSQTAQAPSTAGTSTTLTPLAITESPQQSDKLGSILNGLPAPESAPLLSGTLSSVRQAPARPSGHLITPVPLVTNLSLTNHYNFYERHKQLQQATSISSQYPRSTNPNNGAELFESVPAENITPLTQQQYQALLKDLKLCNNSSHLTTPATTTYLTTRDSNQHELSGIQQKHIHKSKLYNQQQQQQFNSQHLKSANQHLSQLLHSNRDDLIHLHKSPDYCKADARHGFVGIQSRICSENPLAPDNCDKLCCGRGFTQRIYQQSFKCDCKFQYCCSIYCSVCKKENKLLVCN